MKSLSSGNLKLDYARFCIPCVVNLAVFSIYSIVDALFVSRYINSDALAAVTLSHPFLSLLFCIGITLAVGGSTLIAKALGEKNEDYANFIFSQNLVVTIIISLLISITVSLLLEPCCILLGAADETMSHTMDYMGTLAPFSMAFVLEYNMEFLVKTDGNPGLSLFTVIGSSLLNIFLDWLFVARLDMGTYGAALATGIAQTLASVTFLSYILFSKKGLFHFRKFKWNLRIYGKLLALGAADGSMEILSALLILIYNRVMRDNLGTDGVAAFGIVIYISNLVFNMNTGATQGMEPLVSYHKGAKEQSACKKLYRYALTVVLILCLASFLSCQFYTEEIISLFFNDAAANVALLAASGLRIYSYTFLFMGFNLLTSGYMTAQCRPAFALTISLCRAFFLQAAALFVVMAVLGIDYVWFSAVLSEGMMAVVSILLLISFNRQLCPCTGQDQSW